MQFGLNRHECLNFAFVLHKKIHSFSPDQTRVLFFLSCTWLDVNMPQCLFSIYGKRRTCIIVRYNQGSQWMIKASKR